MASVLLVGTDEALLEGIAQSLATVGHNPFIAHTVAEASRAEPPVIAIVERATALHNLNGLRLRLASGGALLLYRTDGPAEPPLPPVLQRVTVADLTLPLERLRLVTLVQHLCVRARDCGRAGVSGEGPRVETSRG